MELNPALKASLRALVNLHERAGREQPARLHRERLDFLTQLPQTLVHVLDLMHENKLDQAEGLCRDFLQKNKTPH